MAAAVQVCTLTFQPRSGVGTQTVSGIVDRDGNAFTPTYLMFQGGFTVINTLMTQAGPGGPANASANDQGFANATDGVGTGLADALAFGSFRHCSGGEASYYSLIGVGSSPFFGGYSWRLAYVSAIRSGEFDLVYDQNDNTGDTVRVTAFGGSALNVEILFDGLTNGVKPVSSDTLAPVVGIYAMQLTYPFNHAPSYASGSGGVAGTSVGWDTKLGTPGTAWYWPGSQTSGYRYMRNDQMNAWGSYVSSWDATKVTISGAGTDPNGYLGAGFPIAFSGTGVAANSGAITQPLSAGVQTFNVGINAKWLVLASNGRGGDNAFDSTQGTHSLAWSDSTRQTGFWTGDGEATLPVGIPVKGARYLSNTDALRFAAPDAASTTFTAIATIQSISSDGTVRLNWSSSDGVPREIIWFALGEAAIPVLLTNPMCLVPLPLPVLER